MSTTVTTPKTKPAPKLDDGDAQWPPLVHIARKPVTEKSRALCGAKLHIGELPNATKVCEKCIEIARNEIRSKR